MRNWKTAGVGAMPGRMCGLEGVRTCFQTRGMEKTDAELE